MKKAAIDSGATVDDIDIWHTHILKDFVQNNYMGLSENILRENGIEVCADTRPLNDFLRQLERKVEQSLNWIVGMKTNLLQLNIDNVEMKKEVKAVNGNMCQVMSVLTSIAPGLTSVFDDTGPEEGM